MRKAKKIEATRFIEYCDFCGLEENFDTNPITSIEDCSKEIPRTIIFINICNDCIHTKLFPILLNEYPILKLWKRMLGEYWTEGEEVK